ncbi:MAG: shikimate dehydrogenase [Muribaculaceae bacterium]|nr:shikimate dehydrogenase [Muribaculaceae bacterium]
MYGLTGYPLGHSFSEKYFSEKFERENIGECYRLFPMTDLQSLDVLLTQNADLMGLNVTIPYKKDIIKYLDALSVDAERIGAVNVVKIHRNADLEKPVLIGYNTDWKGFSLSLSPLLSGNEKSALVLGTGGASAAVIFALKELGIKPVMVSRHRREDVITYEDIDEKILSENLLIINTTPLGMFPNTETAPPLPYHLLSSSHICYDLVYNPAETEFMKRCRQMGAIMKNGLEMLHIQAELSWKIWNES